MNKESILYGIMGLVAGAVIAGFSATYAVNNSNQGMMDDSDMTIGQMSGILKNKTGDDFDKLFISGMIMHHQGAIDMARLAEQNARHDEVKNLAKDIMSAQSKEIDEMQTWQTQWGYKITPSTQSHNMMDMGH